MPNYFYTDPNGQKQGPIDAQQLRELAAQGIITPKTPMETESGHKGVAEQIRDLKFQADEPPPFVQTTQVGTLAKQATGSTFLWLFDFAFQDIRIHFVMLWFCRVAYVLACIVIILFGFWGTYMTFRSSEFLGPLVLITVPFQWLVVIFQVFLVRLYFEGILLLFNWITETTKAARIYIENSKNK